MVSLERTAWLSARPALKLPITLGLLAVVLVTSVPLVFGVFKQSAECNVRFLEQRFRNATTSDGSPITYACTHSHITDHTRMCALLCLLVPCVMCVVCVVWWLCGGCVVGCLLTALLQCFQSCAIQQGALRNRSVVMKARVRRGPGEESSEERESERERERARERASERERERARERAGSTAVDRETVST